MVILSQKYTLSSKHPAEIQNLRGIEIFLFPKTQGNIQHYKEIFLLDFENFPWL